MTRWVGRLLAANVAAYFLSRAFPILQVAGLLQPATVPLRPWTPLTYMFLHASPTHLLFNMIVLFFFGPRVEDRLGGRAFLQLYVISGLAAAALSFATPRALIVGASGAIYGVTLAFAYFWPRDRIYIWAVIPVEARWLIAFFTVMAVWGIATGARDGIAHYAHLGGFVGAFGFLKWREKTSPAARFKAKAEGRPRRGPLADRQALERWSRIDPTTMHEVNREAYERVRAKLEAEGIGGLTARERAFLDRFSPD
ncbi:MAG: rhomboid family intramembrane serine protease [Gemmatimonadota bacterium]